MNMVLSGCLVASCLSLPLLGNGQVPIVVQDHIQQTAIDDYIADLERQGDLGETYVKQLYIGVSQNVPSDLGKAVEYYRKAEIYDPNFPRIINFEDGSFLVSDPTGIFESESIRQKYVDILLSYEILEDESEVFFCEEGAYVMPQCVKKKVGLKKTHANGAKTIATH